MKSFKIVGIILGLTVSALIYFNNQSSVTDTVEDSVGTSVAAPKSDIPF